MGYPGFSSAYTAPYQFAYPAVGSDGRVTVQDALASFRTWAAVRKPDSLSDSLALVEIIKG
jgi:hypothetical protein